MRNNIDPFLWGKHFWRTIYFSIEGLNDTLTDEDRQNFAKLFDSLKHLLPCKLCRENLLQKDLSWLETSATKQELFEHVVDIENQIKMKNNRKDFANAEQTKIHLYEQKSYTLIIALSVFAIIIYIFFKK